MNRTITALVNLLRTFADELEAGAVESVAAEAAAPATPKKRGRPAAAATPTEPAQQPAEPATPEPPVEDVKGIPLEELQALIKPAIEASQGKKVKEIITKHGGTQLSTIPAANHAAFKEDIEGLVY